MKNILNSKHYGNAIAQYAIIIALIAAALTPVFYVFGNQIFGNFKNQLSVFSENNSGITAGNNFNSNTLESISPEETVLNVFTPQNDCTNSSCTINYGPIVLEGVPKDLSEIIETTGTAGGTTELAALLEQIADQVENMDQVSQEDKTKIDQLASLAYQMALYESSIEKISSQGLTLIDNIKASYDEAYYNTLSEEDKATYVSNLVKPLEDFMSESSEINTDLTESFSNIISQSLINNSELMGEFSSSTDLSNNIRSQFDNLLTELLSSDSNLDPSLKNIVNVLGSDVQMLADNMTNSIVEFETAQISMLQTTFANEEAYLNEASTSVKNVVNVSPEVLGNIVNDSSTRQEVINNLYNNLALDFTGDIESEHLSSYENILKYQVINIALERAITNSDSSLTSNQIAGLQALKVELISQAEISYTDNIDLYLGGECGIIGGMFDLIGKANEGLTSQQTNLDAKLIDVSGDNEQDAEPDNILSDTNDQDKTIETDGIPTK